MWLLQGRQQVALASNRSTEHPECRTRLPSRGTSVRIRLDAPSAAEYHTVSIPRYRFYLRHHSSCINHTSSSSSAAETLTASTMAAVAFAGACNARRKTTSGLTPPPRP